ncbi:MAG: HD domain-containing protein [Pseudobdellovibrio sp.]
MNLESLLPFIKEIDKLKKVERQTLNYTGDRRENTAEHSWHLAVSVLVCANCAPEKINVEKTMKMALLHDLVEIDAGDTFIYGDQSAKKSDEERAAKRITGLLPEAVAQDLLAIWHEFEAGESAEARFVAALDRFLPLYSNYLNKGYSWQNHNVKSEKVIAKCQPPIEAGLPQLWPIAQQMIDESIERGNLMK